MLETLGNLGDFVGGLGVLVSLVYLAVQIRQNTVATRADSYQDAVAAANEWSREVGARPEVCQMLIDGFGDYDGLPDLEKMQFNLLMASYFRNMENLHAKYASGVIDEQVWQGWANRLRVFLDAPGVAAFWRDNRSAFAADFRRHLDELPSSDELPYGPTDLVHVTDRLAQEAWDRRETDR